MNGDANSDKCLFIFRGNGIDRINTTASVCYHLTTLKCEALPLD